MWIRAPGHSGHIPQPNVAHESTNEGTFADIWAQAGAVAAMLAAADRCVTPSSWQVISLWTEAMQFVARHRLHGISEVETDAVNLPLALPTRDYVQAAATAHAEDSLSGQSTTADIHGISALEKTHELFVGLRESCSRSGNYASQFHQLIKTVMDADSAAHPFKGGTVYTNY